MGCGGVSSVYAQKSVGEGVSTKKKAAGVGRRFSTHRNFPLVFFFLQFGLGTP